MYAVMRACWEQVPGARLTANAVDARVWDLALAAGVSSRACTNGGHGSLTLQQAPLAMAHNPLAFGAFAEEESSL